MAGDAFDQDDGAVELGGARRPQPIGSRSTSSSLAVEQRRELARVGQQDRACSTARASQRLERCAAARRRARARHRFEAARRRSALQASPFGHARTGDDRIDLARLLGDALRQLRRRSRRRRLRAGRRPSLRAWRCRAAAATLSTVAIRSLPAPARIAAVAASSAAPGTSRLPAMTRIRPLVSLSPSTIGGSGCCVERIAVERLAGFTASPPSRRAPRSWARPRLRAARHSSTGSSSGTHTPFGVGLELVGRNAAVEHFGLLVDLEDLPPRRALRGCSGSTARRPGGRRSARAGRNSGG